MTPIWNDDDDLPEAPPAVEHEGALAIAVSRLPEVNDVNFSTKHIGGGYDRAEVDAFLHELSESVGAVRAAVDSGREELANLRAENARLSAAAGADLEQEIAAGAVGLLSQAQLIADRAVADAEQYARDLVVAARDEYREVLERAERSAGHVVAGLAMQEGPSLPEIEYVRTYAKVAQIQLRSVLDALTEQVDRLGTLPQADQEPAESSSADDEAGDEPVGEPDWARPVATRGSYVEPETYSIPASFSDSESGSEPPVSARR